MPVSISTKGLKEATKVLKTLQKLGAVINSVELIGHPRKEGDVDNAEVFGYLAEGGRDFAYMDEATLSKIGNILADEMTKGLKQPSRGQSEKAWANAIAGIAFRAAMKYAVDLFSQRIERGDWEGDGGELNPDYAAWKKSKFGFEKPIGKASGQLFHNLTPSSKNIKLRKR